MLPKSYIQAERVKSSTDSTNMNFCWRLRHKGLMENGEKEKIENKNGEKRKRKYPNMEVFFFFFRYFPFRRFPPNPAILCEVTLAIVRREITYCYCYLVIGATMP